MKNIFEKLALDIPIISAPLALFPMQNRLVAKVSDAGGLGAYSCYGQSLSNVIRDIDDIKSRTNRAFAICIVIEDEATASETQLDLADLSKVKTLLDVAYSDLEINSNQLNQTIASNSELFKVMIDKRPNAIIFQNGLPNNQVITTLQSYGIVCFAVASNLLEALAIEHSPADGIILQGLESAGLLSQFTNNLVEKNSFYPINTLINGLFSDRNLFSKAIISWGNHLNPLQVKHIIGNCHAIDNNDGIAAIMLDSAIWSCWDIQLPDDYITKLKSATEMSSTITTAFTGQPCRTLTNKITEKLNNNNFAMRKQLGVLSPIISSSIAKNKPQYMPMWAGYRNHVSNLRVSELIASYKIKLD